MYWCPRLEIKQSSEGALHVPGLVEAHVSNINEVWDVLQTGSNARAVGATNANEHSSRSHWFVYRFLIFSLLTLLTNINQYLYLKPKTQSDECQICLQPHQFSYFN